MEEALGPFHVPQHSRRVKLRITPPTTDPNLDLHSYLFSSGTATGSHDAQIIAMNGPALPSPSSEGGIPSSIAGALNLSLATHGRAGQQVTPGQRSGRSATAVAVATTPVGPFTGYASILSRSRFLKPAEELLLDFCGVNRVTDKGRVLEPSMGDNWGQKVVDRCADSNLLSILHEVFKRYRLYQQQMQSAVSSFESVAGLANAAPFISFAIKAVSKHFHCLKKAILDYINLTSTGSGSNDFRNGKNSSALFSPDGSHEHEQAPHQQLQFRGPMPHPVWRTQRGFPEKAVAVLRTWLFENFLHPYPTDSDKEMLARRTGLSRSQVSNWFTNARVRLWKPMVEEIHSLEKQRRFPSETDQRKFVNVFGEHFSSMNPEKEPNAIEWVQESENRQNNSQVFGRGQISEMRPDLYLVGPEGGRKTEPDKHSTSSSGYGAAPEGAISLTWSNCGQTVPFWLAK